MRQRKKAAEDRMGFEQRMVQKLVAQIEKYERYFESREDMGRPMDHPAANAYANLLKTVIALTRKQENGISTDGQMREEMERVLEAEYGIKR